VHELVYVFTSLVVAGSWWVAVLVIGLLFQKLPAPWQTGWRHGVMIILGFVVAGVCTLITAHLVEHTFHVTILKRYDDE
jgi:hypothetical protein